MQGGSVGVVEGVVGFLGVGVILIGEALSEGFLEFGGITFEEGFGGEDLVSPEVRFRGGVESEPIEEEGSGVEGAVGIAEGEVEVGGEGIEEVGSGEGFGSDGIG